MWMRARSSTPGSPRPAILGANGGVVQGREGDPRPLPLPV